MKPAADVKAAVRHLKKADPVLAAIMKRIGPCRWKIAPIRGLFEALLESIIYQQLHGKAAAAIHGRVLDLFPDHTPAPGHLASITDEALRAAGLSRAKLASIRALAAKALTGALPTLDEARGLPDEELGLDTGGRQVKGWTNKLIWGDIKLILSSLKAGALRRQIEDAGGLKLIYIDPPFYVGADFSMDIEIGGETFHKEPNLLEQTPKAFGAPGGAARIPSSP